jgi:hypothetical protein
MAQKKNAAAVVLGRRGGKKGGPARAANMTPEQRSESARKAVRARWTKAKKGSDHMILKSKAMGIKTFNRIPAPVLDTSRKALHLCLKRLKMAKDQTEIERLTEELQRIVFHKQYQNAED